ncbi:hypothetical protein HXX76_008839 [Chlamydomonas incerta]|uniref:Uncharacterized protein n=1 Tax=Chlamydomonas incerta TaxID=51695 RepID=A0A835W0H7_CHLIN|nr:hypothetical protein HXX76_008839 [Chlamydomonas incerta]|eukprot:KAG2432494.1 hypothetical protein HXX76_008839 [Chlamydomonas incerta]
MRILGDYAHTGLAAGRGISSSTTTSRSGGAGGNCSGSRADGNSSDRASAGDNSSGSDGAGDNSSGSDGAGGATGASASTSAAEPAHTLRLAAAGRHWTGLKALEEAYGEERLAAIRESLRTARKYEQPVVLHDASDGTAVGRFQGALVRNGKAAKAAGRAPLPMLYIPVKRLSQLLEQPPQWGALLRLRGFDDDGALRAELVHRGGPGSQQSRDRGMNLQMNSAGDWLGIAAFEQAYGVERLNAIRQSLLREGPYALSVALHDASSGRTMAPIRAAMVINTRQLAGRLPSPSLRIQNMPGRMGLQAGSQLRLIGLAADGRTLVVEVASLGDEGSSAGAGSSGGGGSASADSSSGGGEPHATPTAHSLDVLQLTHNGMWRGVYALTQALGDEKLRELERNICDGGGHPYPVRIVVLDGATAGEAGRYSGELRVFHRKKRDPYRAPYLSCPRIKESLKLQTGAQLLPLRLDEATGTLEVRLLRREGQLGDSSSSSSSMPLAPRGARSPKTADT